MINRPDRFRTDNIVLVRALVGICLLVVSVGIIHILSSDFGALYTLVACVLLCLFFILFVYLGLNPDALRSRYTEETLYVASNMLDDLKDGLTRESAEKICLRLLPETHASSIAITDTSVVLSCVGDMADDFPPGSPVHNPATRYVLKHDTCSNMASFSRSRRPSRSQASLGDRGRSRRASWPRSRCANARWARSSFISRVLAR